MMIGLANGWQCLTIAAQPARQPYQQRQRHICRAVRAEYEQQKQRKQLNYVHLITRMCLATCLAVAISSSVLSGTGLSVMISHALIEVSIIN